MHLAETREQAYADVEHGIATWFDYFQHTAAFPQMAVGDGTNVKEFIDFVNESGIGTIGTPDDAVEQIERLVEAVQRRLRRVPAAGPRLGRRRPPSAAASSCSPATSHPASRASTHSTVDAKARARAARPELAESNLKAVETATAKYQAELAAKGSAG